MKKFAAFLLTVLLLLAVGCAKPADAPMATAEARLTEAPAEAAETPAPTPTEAPTPKPTQMPAPEPMSAEDFKAATAREAAETIKSTLAAFPCYTASYEKTDYGAYVDYDEAHDCVALRMADERGGELLTALTPLMEAGKLPRLMLNTDEGEEITGSLPGVKELILSTYDNDCCAFLADCADVESLTVVNLDITDKAIGYPPAMKSLTVESSDGGDVDLWYLCGEDGTLLSKLTSLTVGVRGAAEPPEFLLPEDTDEPLAGLPALTALNLWIERDESTARLYEKALALPQLKTLNGLGKTAFGPYKGMDMEAIQDDLMEKVMAYKEEGTPLPAAGALPKTINGPVNVFIGPPSSSNLEYESDVVDSADVSLGYYGIPKPMVWQEDMPEDNAYLAYIYEHDTITGWYGDKENEIWGYAVQTRLLLVELATGKLYQATVAKTNPPRTNAEDTYGDYCPLRAVEQLRTRIVTDVGPLMGYTMDDAVNEIYFNMKAHALSYAKNGLPSVINGRIRVIVWGGEGTVAEDQSVGDSDFWGDDSDDDTDYGIPADCLLEQDDEAGWLIFIMENAVVTRQYGEEFGEEDGYSVETHLFIVNMATGQAWHKLVKTAPPPPTPEETNYGAFCPRAALSLVKPLIKYVPQESPAAE